MKERPILFSAPMVRALLDGRKTQARRAIKPQPVHPFRSASGAWVDMGRPDDADHKLSEIRCPYRWPPLGDQPGDLLWVRETWRGTVNIAPPGKYELAVAKYIPNQDQCVRVEFAATQSPDREPWRPSIHMPRWASRITLQITDVRIERLRQITRGACMAEGCPFPNIAGKTNPKQWFADLWQSLNGVGSWDANPWVWVIEFKRVTP